MNEGELTRLHSRLLVSKGSDYQLSFLDSVKDNERFLNFMDREVSSLNGKSLDLIPCPLTEHSFKDLTKEQEKSAFDSWSDVHPRQACRVSFWAFVTLDHIRSGKVQQSSWLASNGSRNEGGEERIDRALSENDPKGIDDCVRTIIRRMSGLPGIRGNRSVFVNPPFGRAWWRERMVARIEKREGVENRRALLDVVRTSQQYWENIVTMVVSRGSVFGSVIVQDAFINSLAKHFRAEPATPLRTATRLTQTLRWFSNIAASREIGILDFDELGVLVDDMLTRILESH